MWVDDHTINTLHTHLPASSSTPIGGGVRHDTTPLPSSPLPTLNDDIEDDDVPGAIPSNLSPTSCRHIHNCLYMQCKRAKASSHVVWLKPSHKASVTSKCRQPRRDTNEQPA